MPEEANGTGAQSGDYTDAVNNNTNVSVSDTSGAFMTLASAAVETTLDLTQISVGVLAKALENVAFLGLRMVVSDPDCTSPMR